MLNNSSVMMFNLGCQLDCSWASLRDTPVWGRTFPVTMIKKNALTKTIWGRKRSFDSQFQAAVHHGEVKAAGIWSSQSHYNHSQEQRAVNPSTQGISPFLYNPRSSAWELIPPTVVRSSRKSRQPLRDMPVIQDNLDSPLLRRLS